MEVSVLQWLLNNIDSFLNLSKSSCANLNNEPLRRYYQNIEGILKLLSPVLDAITEIDAASDDDDDLLKKAFLELAQSVDASIDLFKTWHPLASRLIFVLEAESLTTNIRSRALEIFRSLKYTGSLSTASLEKCTQETESTVCGHAEALISDAIKDEAAGSELSPDRLMEIADLLGIESNQEIFIEAVALEKLKENRLMEIADLLGIESNQEIFIEAVALEKLEENAEQAEKKEDMEYYDHMIALIMRFHDHLVAMKHSENSNPIPIPPDFCCPLSLDLMTDPVIISSGQTYERLYISKWLDLGLDVCPKTRQPLGHTILTPNYTVKALVAGWCEQNNVMLPDPVRSIGLNQPLTRVSPIECGILNSMVPHSTEKKDSLEHQPSFSEEKDLHSNGYDSLSLSAEGLPVGPTRTVSNQSSGDVTEVSQSQEAQRIGTSGKSMKEKQALPRLIDAKSYNGTMPSPRIVSSSSMEPRPDLDGVEYQVNRLLEDLNSSVVERQREAAAELRILAKKNMDNRVIISNCGAITLLINLLYSTDSRTQKYSVTTLLNLSLSDNNKSAIANAGAIEPLIHVLKTGSPEAKGNAAATLFSLSVIEENKLKIGKAGAIGPLVDLLANGSLSGKKDATAALYNLSILHENKAKIVEAGAISHLIELMDPAAGMVDKAVAALANLATIQEGKNAIGQLGGIPVLVEVVELGSARGKENAAATLLQLCMMSAEFCKMALQEGVVPPVVALSQLGTARGKEKAQALLNCFRNQRHGSLRRG
ncbi:hypothetical protein V2J09_001378 [Rumex salicifolius]